MYGAAMDCSKAFDMCSWVSLFNDLIEKGVAAIFLRVLMFIYKNQACDIQWNAKFSQRFPVTNGVRQGAIISPLFFSVYVDKLIKRLRYLGIGCKVNGQFYGILVYADDIFLLCPSRDGLQTMISECERFASKKNLKFSVNPDPKKSKTKCIIFSKKTVNRDLIAPIMLYGVPLPFVPSLLHLGNTLEEDNSMSLDTNIKRCKFIGKINSLSQEFFFTTPDVRTKLFFIYTTSFYGSNLYDLYNRNTEKLFTTWNKTIRLNYDLPYLTHRYLIEPVTNNYHLKTLLCSRFMKFSDTLNNCKEPSV